ncbi:hypothetical protein SAMN05216474_0939 [Lishizhenia tianjinensis]|uniref:Uncharacterized protein n=2 Tax=Lishizhenia tianjinensis TaxID=477690 RepID=A0A1I6YJ18_9FLAO|nr:hypothetical protein SAMN05216474_0939 [Lishizhenia tianjinensis]
MFIPVFLWAQKDSIQELEGVDITAFQQVKLPTLEDEYVLDYLFDEQEIVLLSKLKLNYIIRRVDADFKELERIELKQKPERFYTDCMGYHHLLTTDSAYQIYFGNEGINFLYPMLKDKFLSLLSNCVGTTEKGLVYETFMNKNQTHMFIEFDTINDVNNLLYISNDMENYFSLLEDQIRHELEWAANINNLSAMSINFNHMVLSKEGYVPFFNIDTGFVILDHRQNIGIKGNFFQSKEIFDIVYHHKESWADHIIQAENGDIFYAKLLDGGLLMIQDLGHNFQEGGKITNVNKHTFPQQLKIKDGYLYYLAREHKEDSYIKLWKVKV